MRERRRVEITQILQDIHADPSAHRDLSDQLFERVYAELRQLASGLTRLGEHDTRMARIVELRVFAGMTGEEIGHVLGLSRQTVQAEWKVARMWLRHQLAEGGEA